MLSAIVLAAGSSRRLGRSKLLLDLGGEPVVRRAVAAAEQAEPGEILVVVSPEGLPEIRAALGALGVRWVVNEGHAEGMGTSIAKAAAEVDPACRALLLLQGDQPLVTAAMLRALVAAWAEGGRAFAASSYQGLVTTPVLFDRALFGDLRALGGDRGARSVLERHRAEGTVVDFSPELGSDVDTEEDYRRVVELWGRRPQG